MDITQKMIRFNSVLLETKQITPFFMINYFCQKNLEVTLFSLFKIKLSIIVKKICLIDPRKSPYLHKYLYVQVSMAPSFQINPCKFPNEKKYFI